MTIRAFEDFIDRVYEKKDGSGVRVERKISRDMEVEELLEMLQKGAPAFEQPKESAPQEEATPRDQIPFYS